MGNKPAAPMKAGSFTHRLAQHSQVAYYPYPVEQPEGVLVTFMLDQLLIGQSVFDDQGPMKAALKNAARKIGTVFDGPGIEQVEIWQLKTATGKQPFPDVAEFVWNFRKDFLAPANIDLGQVAPNHVLIPARDFDQCPFGPPEEPTAMGAPPTMKRLPDLRVVVIDSGWEEKSPAAKLVKARVRADWFRARGSKSTWVVPPGSPLLTPPDKDGKRRLGALVGHANFVAGIIARGCPQATIDVVSHNAAFVEKDASGPGIPTEASVARALWTHRNADLINLGFAFPTLPSVPLTKKDYKKATPPSWAFRKVLDAIDQEHADGKSNRYPYILAPAGNQSSAVPQYPAAFGESRANVIGVGSTNPAGTAASGFSNQGPWVKCCTDGENVLSTFVIYDGETEEDEPSGGGHVKKHFAGWASWSGTCFATPKVTAALARRKANHMTIPQAWDDLVSGAGEGLNMGYVLNGKTP